MKNVSLPRIVLTLLLLLSVSLMANGQTAVCQDDFSYELKSVDSNTFLFQFSGDLKGSYELKLYDVSKKETLVGAKTFSSSSKGVVFSSLNKNSIYLIQAISKDSGCRFTIGGMEGIKFENK